LLSMNAPPELADMHQSVDGWLAAMVGSCDVVVQHTGPLGMAQLDQVREELRRAARRAERFNAERAAIAGESPEETAGGRGRGKLKIAAAVGIVLLLLLGGYVGLGIGQSGAATATSTPGPGAAAGVTRRVYPQ